MQMPTSEARQLYERVLVLAPTRRDAELACSTLHNAGIACLPCESLAQVCDAIAEGAGAALLTEESLAPEYVRPLVAALADQPPWSDLPLLVLTRGGADSPAAVHAMESLGNVMLLERPVRITAMVSAVHTALRARQKQLQIRDHLVLRRLAEGTLERRFMQLQTVYTLTRTMTRTDSLEAIYAAALEQINSAIKADRAAVLLFDHDGVMRFKAWRGLSEEYRNAVEGHSPWGPEQTDPQPITVDDVNCEPSLEGFRATIVGEGIQALAFIPLLYESRLLGKFMLYYNQPHEFVTEEVQLAQNISDHTAFAIARSRATRALRKSEERYRRLVETAAEGVWEIDGNGRTIYANQPMIDMLALSQQEITGLNALEMVHEEDAEIAAEQWRVPGGAHEKRDWRLRRGDGSYIWVTSSAAPVYDGQGRIVGAFAMMTDITDRKTAERRLAAEHSIARILNESQSLGEAAPAILKATAESSEAQAAELWLLDESEQALKCLAVWSAPSIAGPAIKEFESLCGQVQFKPGVGAPGRVWSSLQPVAMTDLGQELNHARLKAARAAGLLSGMAFPILAAGTFYGVIELYSTRQQLPDQPTRQMMSAVGQDIAQFIRRRWAEREVVRHREHLERLVAERTSELERSHQRLRLSERMAALGTLSAGLGHDMGNLLLPIRSRIDAMLGTLRAVGSGANGVSNGDQGSDKSLQQTLLEHINAITQCTDYLQSLTNGLRLLALDPNDATAAGQETDLDSWWPNVENLLKNALPRNVEFVIEGFGGGNVRGRLPALALAPHRLTQAVFNLVKNAGDALRGAADGKVTLAAECVERGDRAVQNANGKLSKASHYVRLSVCDNGPGMSDEVRARAAEPFFTTKTRSLSTGLGLSLVHGIVTGAGGTLDIHSGERQGTRIVMLLPANPQVETPVRQDELITPSALVTLDDFRHSTLVEQLLHSLGYRVSVQDSLDYEDDQVLWVTQSSPEHLEAAERFLRQHPRRVVLVAGQVDHKRSRPGLISMGEPLRFSRIRDTIRRINPTIMEGRQ